MGLSPPPPAPSRAPGPRPQSRAGSESFCDPAGLERRPPPPGSLPGPLPAGPTRLFRAAEGRGGEGRAEQAAALTWDAPPGWLRRGVWGQLQPQARRGRRWEGRGAGRGARPSPGGGCLGRGGSSGLGGLPLPGLGLCWPSSVARSHAGLSPGSAPFSRGGWAGAGATVTSPPSRRLSGERGPRYVQSVYTVTKPAQPSPSDSPPGSGESHSPAREGGRSFGPSRPVGCCCSPPRPPHAGARTLARTQFLDSALSLQKAIWGAARRTSRAGSASPRYQRASPDTSWGHPGASLRSGHLVFVTFVLGLP